MDLWEEMETTANVDAAGMEEEKPVRLPADRRRRYTTFFTALTLVIATASCILVLLVIRMQRQTTADTNAQNAALQDKLTTIESALGTLDQSVMNSDLTAAGTAASYVALGDTVDSLRTNLTDYRDNNDIRNEEIGEHLDSVIAQLDKIKEDMSAAQEESSAQDTAMGSRLDTMTQESAQETTNLTKELQSVHQDIAALIDKAGDDADGNYKELKGILTATDSSLSSLVSSKFDETGSLIASNISGLKGSVDNVGSSVSGLKGTVDTVNSGVSGIQGSVGDVRNSLTAVQSSVTQGFADVGTILGTVNSNVETVHTGLSDVSTDLQNAAGQLDGVLEHLSGVDEDLEGLFSKVDGFSRERADADATTRGHIDSVQEELENWLEEQLELLDKKVDRILRQVEPADPAEGEPGDGGEGGDIGDGGDSGSTEEPETPAEPGEGSTGTGDDESVVIAE